MQIMFLILLTVIVGIGLYYYYNFEVAKETIYELESKIDDYRYTINQFKEKLESVEYNTDKKIKNDLYKLVFQSQNYNSYKDLENKIKTVLTSDQTN